MPIISFSVAAPLRFEDAFILKVKERVHAIRALDINITALSPVTAARAALGNKLFPSKGKAAIPSVSRDKLYFCAINKQVELRSRAFL